MNQGLQEKINKTDKRFTSFKHEWQQFKVLIQQRLEENKSIIMNVESNSIDRFSKDFGESKI